MYLNWLSLYFFNCLMWGFHKKPKHVASKKDINIVVTDGMYFPFDDRIYNHVNNINIHITFSQATIGRKQYAVCHNQGLSIMYMKYLFSTYFSPRDHLQVSHSCDTWHLSFCLLLSSQRCEPN
jgi:hypothetical protein